MIFAIIRNVYPAGKALAVISARAEQDVPCRTIWGTFGLATDVTYHDPHLHLIAHIFRLEFVRFGRSGHLRHRIRRLDAMLKSISAYRFAPSRTDATYFPLGNIFIDITSAHAENLQVLKGLDMVLRQFASAARARMTRRSASRLLRDGKEYWMVGGRGGSGR